MVIITGGGAGLGRAYSLACAVAGARVVVNDVDATVANDTVATIRATGGRASAHVGSVASWDFCRALVDGAVRDFGRLDGLVANAAIKHEALPWDETEGNLRRIHDVNVLGVQFCGTHAMRVMAERRGGSIITVVSGARLGIAGMAAYGATKGAVASMTVSWALDAAHVGIRVNAISPLALTAMAVADTRKDRPALGHPDQVAPLVVSLLSDASSGLTGQIFRFDGTQASVYDPATTSPANISALLG